MKKAMLFIIFIVSIMFSMYGIQSGQTEEKEKSFQVIPDEAIRLRILANSDSERDQQIKRHVRDDVNEYIEELVKDIADIEEARALMDKNVPEIERIVKNALEEQKINQPFTVEYDSDVAFPMKVYDNYVYPAGEYEAILISIGEAKGSNWWCVLFPPLCFLDFSNGSTVAQSDEEVEYDEAANDEEEMLDEDEEQGYNEEDSTEESDDDEIEVKFFLFEWLGLS